MMRWFLFPAFTGTVDESSLGGAVIVTIAATDADDETNKDGITGIDTYSFTDASNVFRIDPGRKTSLDSR